MSKGQIILFRSSLAGSALIIGATSGVFNSLMLFLFVGKIPGTQTYLSPLQMGLFIILVSFIVLFVNLESRIKAQLKLRSKDLPKRRLKQA